MNRQLTKLSLVALLICLFSGLAYAQEPSGYYKKAEGKSQKELLKQLCEIVGPHKNVGYNGLWNVYKDSDIRPGTNLLLLGHVFHFEIPRGTAEVWQLQPCGRLRKREEKALVPS